MCNMSVQTSSTKKRSCETTIMMRLDQVSPVASSRPSQSTACMLRWFVGSSKNRMSGFAKSAAASATRTRQPPLRAFIDRPRSSSLKPRLTNTVFARALALDASIASSWLRHST
mmetsp:Transcript_51469/g.166933  ORF Transcript_51469/g.166933 Transcript_51469/m.166933 type:complete len:114 (-) Transcript_51469:972-1313(-)